MFRHLHGISRFMVALWFSTMALFLRDVRILLCMFALALLMLLWGLGWKAFLSILPSIKRVLPLVIAIVLIQVLFTRRGDMWINLGWIGIHSGSVHHGIMLGIRVMLIYLSAMILTGMNHTDFDAAFRWLHMPQELSFMVAYGVHLIPGLTRLFKAKKLILTHRGVDYARLPYRIKLKLYGSIALSVTAALLHDSDVRSAVLELRGFRCKAQSTRYQESRPGLIDLLLFVLLSVLTVVLVFLAMM